MSRHDLDLFASAPVMVLHLGADGLILWRNARATNLFAGRFADALQTALGTSPSVALALQAAAAQSTPVPAQFTVTGEVWRGTVRRLPDARLLFEETPQRFVGTAFADLTATRRAVDAGLADQRRLSARYQRERDTLRAVVRDIAEAAQQPLAALERHLTLALTPADGGVRGGRDPGAAPLRKALRLARSGREEVAGLCDLATGGFMGKTVAPLHLRPLLAKVLSRADSTPGVRAVTFDWPEDVPVLGDRLLTTRLLSGLLRAGDDEAFGAIRIAAHADDCVLRCSAKICLVRAMGDTARDRWRDRMGLLARLAEMQRWILGAPLNPEGRVVTVTLSAPVAIDALRPDRERSMLADWYAGRDAPARAQAV